MSDCIFCKIVAREIPAEIVYEDEDTLAFLDIAPNNPGHTLVIPKKHVANVFDADDATLSSIMHSARVIAPAIKKAVGADGLHINSNHESSAGQIVFHLHFHIIPRFANDGYKFWPQKKYADGQMQEIGNKIRAEL